MHLVFQRHVAGCRQGGRLRRQVRPRPDRADGTSTAQSRPAPAWYQSRRPGSGSHCWGPYQRRKNCLEVVDVDPVGSST